MRIGNGDADGFRVRISGFGRGLDVVSAGGHRGPFRRHSGGMDEFRWGDWRNVESNRRGKSFNRVRLERHVSRVRRVAADEKPNHQPEHS